MGPNSLIPSEWGHVDAVLVSRRRRDIKLEHNVFKMALQREKALFAKLTDVVVDAIGGQFGWSVLVSKIMHVAREQNLPQECIFLALDYLRRAIATQSDISFSWAQGCADVSLVLAFKMTTGTFLIGGNTFQRPIRTTLRDELSVLQALQWLLISPTSYTFVQMFARRFWLPQSYIQRAVTHLERIASRTLYSNFCLQQAQHN